MIHGEFDHAASTRRLARVTADSIALSLCTISVNDLAVSRSIICVIAHAPGHGQGLRVTGGKRRWREICVAPGFGT